MKKKIITLGLVSIFLLTSLTALTAIGKKTTEATGEPGVDLAVEFTPAFYEKNRQVGLCVKVTNIGTELVKGPISGTLEVKSGFFGTRLKDKIVFEFLEGWEELNPGEERYTGHYLALLLGPLGPGFHINLFQYRLVYGDENPENNVCNQRTISITFLFNGRMRFI